MFNIKSLNLYQNSIKIASYNFEKPINYFYADNSYGKTVMVALLDFLLGKENFEGKIDGLDGITEAELDCGDFLIKRGLVENSYQIKNNFNDKYRNINLDLYKQFITQSILKSNKQIEELNKITGKEISHRTLSLFNFVEQTKLGDLNVVFTKLEKLEYQLNSKEVFKYIFNKENYLKILEKQNEIEDLEKQLKDISINNEKFSFYADNITSLCNKLNIKNTGNYYSLLKRVLELESSSPKNDKLTSDKEQLFLLQAINTLNNQIRNQNELKKQSNLIVDDINKKNILLENLKLIHKDNPELTNLILKIETKINENTLNANLLTIKDYNKTIQSLQNDKKRLEEKLNLLCFNLNSNTYINNLSDLKLLKQYLNKVLTLNNPKDETVVRDKIKRLKSEIKELQRISNNSYSKQINERINFYYSSLKNKLNFVDQDYERQNFRLNFDCNKISVCGEISERDDHGDLIYVKYIPGSHARQTVIQLCCYFAFLELLLGNEYLNLPVMPLLILDCPNQPLSKDNKNQILSLCKLFIKETDNKIKLIITSDFPLTLQDLSSDIMYIELKNGFNPLITPTKSKATN